MKYSNTLANASPSKISLAHIISTRIWQSFRAIKNHTLAPTVEAHQTPWTILHILQLKTLHTCSEKNRLSKSISQKQRAQNKAGAKVGSRNYKRKKEQIVARRDAICMRAHKPCNHGALIYVLLHIPAGQGPFAFSRIKKSPNAQDSWTFNQLFFCARIRTRVFYYHSVDNWFVRQVFCLKFFHCLFWIEVFFTLHGCYV